MLQAVDIRKEYPGTVALDDISVTFEAGIIYALIGKNGAGKSTLVKILAGAVQPTSGRILVDGAEVKLRTPTDAFNNGIATVYQELSLVPHLTVAENILLGRLPMRNGFGDFVVDWPGVFAGARAVLDDMQVDLDVRKKASELSVAQQQIVEIAKAMSFKPSAVMFDEPTSALAQHETENLFKLIRKLADKNVAIIYITHRLGELQQIAETVTVLRDGRYAGSIEMADATAEQIVHMMFGEIVQKQRPADLKVGSEIVMEVRNLERQGWFANVNFKLRKGEILGIAGMLGSGRTELLKAIFGAEAFDEGEIIIAGETVRIATPVRMKNFGLALTPEDRKEEGLIQILSTRANMCLASLGRISTRGFTTKKRERNIVSKLTKKLDIKVSDIEQVVSSLSGGNQQKVVVGNWLNANPRVILFDEPTRGIDVRAKQQLFQIMWDLSRQGVGCIFVSSELEELVEVCHRILVMKKGRIVHKVRPDQISPDQLFVLCMEQ
jgi:ribose transport system ATP-binding protein